jgi:trimeric autotransporter adhesin
MKRGLNKENSLPDPEFGGESSESARAIHYVVQKDTLMTYVSARFAQADPGIVSGSTTERKQMSTKTSFKRIALVAVASLGAGVLSVAPASAGAQTSITVSDASTTVFVGGVAQLPISVVAVGATGSQAAGDVVTLTPTLLTQPTGATVPAIPGSNANALAHNAAAVGSNVFTLRMPGASNAVSTAVSTVYVPTVAADSKLTLTPAANAAAGTYGSGSLDFMANTPGTYTFAVTPTLGTAGSTTLTAGTFTVKVLSVGGKIGDGGAVASPFNAVNGVAGANNYVTLQANGMARTSGALGTQVEVTGGTVISASAGTVSTDKTKILIAGVTNASNPGTESTILVATPTVGTITVRTFVETAAGIYSATAADTVTITVAAAVQNGTLSVANSTSIIDGTGTLTAAGHNATADEAVLVSKTQSTPTDTEIAIIKVTLKDTLTGVMPNTTSLSATISGPGTLGIGATPTAASGRAVSSTTTSGVVYVTVYADGTEGVGTITLSVGTTTVATETVTFYGTATKYVAVVKKAHIANSGSSTADVIEVTATDKGGNLVPSAVIGASVGTSTIATVVSSATTASTGKALFAMTGLATKFGSVVVTFADSATAPTVTTTATVGVSSVLAKTVAAAVTAAPTPGAPITWTLTFKDANGLGLPDGDYAAGTLLANSAANPVASASLASTPFAGNATISLVAGVATAKGFAPLTAGPVSYTWTLAGTAGAADSANLVTALQATTVTASTTVAQNADISAITTLINSLIAKINALSKLVAKIQKKVRA